MEELVPDAGASLITLVFLRITWHNGDLGPTVVALCIDIFLAMVPGLWSASPTGKKIGQ